MKEETLPSPGISKHTSIARELDRKTTGWSVKDAWLGSMPLPEPSDSETPGPLSYLQPTGKLNFEDLVCTHTDTLPTVRLSLYHLACSVADFPHLDWRLIYLVIHAVFGVHKFAL